MTRDDAVTPGDAPSVAISTMDRPDALRRCLRSLADGRLRPAEVVVVDQSRGHGTRDVVTAMDGGPLHVRYVRMAPTGLGASQNRAVALATRPVVAITDDDCVVDGEWLLVIARAFAQDPTLDGLGGRVLALPPDGERTWPVSTRTSTTRVEFHGRGAPWAVGSGNNFAVRRDAFLRIGGCDERLGPGSPGLGGVDMDLFYRLLRAGAHLRYEPDALVHHERQTRADRLARRPLYGHGMGASIAMRLRERDARAAGLLGAWLALRARLLAGAARRGDRAAAREELTMLRSTIAGLRHGLAAPRRTDTITREHGT